MRSPGRSAGVRGSTAGSGSLRILGMLEGVAMIERLHPDDRAIVGIDVDTGSELWDRPVTEPGLNRVLDGTSLVTRIGVSNEAGLTFIDPTSGDEVGRVDGELFSTDLLGRWFVRDGASIVELDLRCRLVSTHVARSTRRSGRRRRRRGRRPGRRGRRLTLTVSDADGGESTVEVRFRELGPVASIRSLYPMAGSTFVIGTETASYGAVLGADGVELRWEVDGHVVNTSATDRGLTLLTAAAGGTDLRVIDASTGTTITPLSLEPGSIDTLRLVANGVVVERPAVIGAERVGLDLDGAPMWSLIGSGPVAIGDELDHRCRTDGRWCSDRRVRLRLCRCRGVTPTSRPNTELRGDRIDRRFYSGSVIEDVDPGDLPDDSPWRPGADARFERLPIRPFDDPSADTESSGRGDAGASRVASDTSPGAAGGAARRRVVTSLLVLPLAIVGVAVLARGDADVPSGEIAAAADTPSDEPGVRPAAVRDLGGDVTLGSGDVPLLTAADCPAQRLPSSIDLLWDVDLADARRIITPVTVGEQSVVAVVGLRRSRPDRAVRGLGGGVEHRGRAGTLACSAGVGRRWP